MNKTFVELSEIYMDLLHVAREVYIESVPATYNRTVERMMQETSAPFGMCYVIINFHIGQLKDETEEQLEKRLVAPEYCHIDVVNENVRLQFYNNDILFTGTISEYQHLYKKLLGG